MEMNRAQRNDLQQALTKSWQRIAPVWPLHGLVANNPLQGYTELSFEQAYRVAVGLRAYEQLPAPLHTINRLTIKWMQLLCSPEQAVIGVPQMGNSFYQTALYVAQYDAQVHNNRNELRMFLSALPQSADKAVEFCVQQLGVSEDKYEMLITVLLQTATGWAGFVQHQVQHGSQEAQYAITQADYTAFRLVLTCCIWSEISENLHLFECIPDQKQIDHTLNVVRETETAYAEQLSKQLQGSKKSDSHKPVQAQLLFCIDVRSERVRKHFESTGDYQTFGCAGFFGLPIRVNDMVQNRTYASCPPLVTPQHTVTVRSTTKKQSLSSIWSMLYASMKYSLLASVALVEATGLLHGVQLGMRALFRFLSYLWADVAPVEIDNIDTIPLEQQAKYAYGLLRMIGLTDNFAPLIVLVGHTSRTTNNASAAFLDCGACGGHPGGINARVLAHILNTTKVRELLAQKGIIIPDKTYVIAAEHRTTTDSFVVYDDALPESHVDDVRALQKRCTRLPRKTLFEHPDVDWAQVRPEWGLARNAALVIGPRSATEHVDLQGRVFLHSYEWKDDVDGSILSNIFAGPGVVAQAINAQYLFSTLDNARYGAGSKVTSTVVGDVGVMQGNGSDLMGGLPLQSVYATDDTPYHIPQRLLIVVYAPQTVVDQALKNCPAMQCLVDGNWVQLRVRDMNSQ